MTTPNASTAHELGVARGSACASETVRSLPEDAECTTNAIARGASIVEGWETPDGRYYESSRYPGALNYHTFRQLHYKPAWARHIEKGQL